MKPRGTICLPLLAMLACSAPAASQDRDIFTEVVAPIFERRCLSCHNSDERKGGLSLHSEEAMRRGGEGGAIVQDGDVENSSLIAYISGDEPEMPKDGQPLTADEVTAIRLWADGGAKWSEPTQLEDKSLADMNWWSLKPLRRPPLP